MSYAVESVNWGDIVAMIRRIPVFQQGAVCLTKFGPELGETAKEILTRKDLERRSGIRAHKSEFWWGIGEKGTAQSINKLISQYDATIVLFSAIKNQEPPARYFPVARVIDCQRFHEFRRVRYDRLVQTTEAYLQGA